MNANLIKKYSVVIIGAGPAGSSAAKILSKAGISVAIIDKNIFPRDKLCGGLLTKRSKLVFESIFDNDDWSKIVDYSSSGCSFYSGYSKINEVNNYSKIYFTNRYNFDNILLNSAVRSGTQTYLGSQLVKIDNSSKSIMLKDNRIIEYEFLIGADGVNSFVSKYLFGKSYNKEKIAFGLEVDIDRKEMKDSNIVLPEIFFGLVNWGYVWVFPKKDKLTIGAGGLLTKNINLNKVLLVNFIKKRFGIVLTDEKIRGHHLPFGNFRSTPGIHNILLCGDASGLVEPITGEGIAFAMDSGKMCGMSIIKAIEANTNNALCFYIKNYKKITKIFFWSKILRNFIFHPLFSKMFIKLLSKSNSMPKKYLDLLEDKIKYEELIKYFIKKIIIKPIFKSR
jgi:menaquinone-9 beta-reductase